MSTQQVHTMVLVEEFPDGGQEWECPTCGRRFIMHWPPNYHREILVAGDEEAMHSGGTGGVSMGDMEVRTPAEMPSPADGLEESTVPEDLDDPYLAPFAHWLDDKNR